MERRRYPTDLSDEEWGLLQPYLPPPRRRGRPRRHYPREVLNAVFYVLKTSDLMSDGTDDDRIGFPPDGSYDEILKDRPDDPARRPPVDPSFFLPSGRDIRAR